MKLYYNDDYIKTRYSFDTTRKSELVAKRATEQGFEIADPAYAYEKTEAVIANVHDEEYVNAVKTGRPQSLAESQGFSWDNDMYTTVLAHNAGCVAAVDTAAKSRSIAGTLSSGLHHAKRKHGSGFCTFNGVAVASHYANSVGFNNVLILDFDAHCGGGTYSLIDHNKNTHIDVSCNSFDAYSGGINNSDLLLIVDDKKKYVDHIENVLSYVTGIDAGFDFVIYNAGMDPINSGVSRNDLAEREELVAGAIKELGVPAMFTLAGGYSFGGFTMDDIADVHMMTVDSLLGVRVN